MDFSKAYINSKELLSKDDSADKAYENGDSLYRDHGIDGIIELLENGCVTGHLH